MPIESLQEIDEYLKTNAETEEVQTFLNQFKPSIDKDMVSAYLESEDGRGIKQSIADKSYEKGIADFKERHLQELVDQEILKRNPPKTEAEKRLAELEKKIADSEAEKLRERLLNNTTKFFAENENLKGYAEYAPTLAELALSGTEDATQAKAELMVKSLLGIASDMRAADIASRAKKPEGVGGSLNVDEYDKKMAELRKARDAGDFNAGHQMNILRIQKRKQEV